MIWNLVFWAGVTFLIVTVLFRWLLSRRPASAAEPSVVGRFLGRGWIAPVSGILVSLVALVFIYWPQLSKNHWNESEQAEVDHFTEALSLYVDATTLSKQRGVTREDWESVNALLQASLSEAEQVSDSTLQMIDPELPNVFREKFMGGLRIGAYGLRSLTSSPKDIDTAAGHPADSLSKGRALLEAWNAWYYTHKAELTDKLE